jgi:predicted small lipoprotein YifL
MVIQKPSALARARQSLYGAARIGDFVVISNYRPSSSGWAIILLSVTALALGGCGRKGGLDLPPNAPPQSSATSDTETERAAQPGVFNSTYGAEAGPSAPKGSKKKFILDPLLN